LPFWGGVPPQNGLKNVSPALDPLRAPEGAGGGGQGVGDEFASSIYFGVKFPHPQSLAHKDWEYYL
jgi:hypothetical protein